MQALGPIITNAFASVGTAFMGSTIAAGASTAALASAGAGITGSILSGVVGIAQLTQQQRAAREQAAIEAANAQNIQEAATRESQDLGEEAAQILAQDEARLAASGFSLSSPSFLRRSARSRRIAQDNQVRTLRDGQIQAADTQNRAVALRRQSRGGMLLALLGTGINIGSDMISSANLVNENTARRMGITASGVVNGA